MSPAACVAKIVKILEKNQVWGPRSFLARRMDVAGRTVRRWAKGETSPGPRHQKLLEDIATGQEELFLYPGAEK